MRDLSTEELGHVYGAGTYGKPSGGNNAGNVEGRGKAKRAKKPKAPKTGTGTRTG